METAKVRNAFGGLVDDVRVLTTQRNDLTVALHNILAVMDRDEVYLHSASRPGESISSCGTRLVSEARALIASKK